MIILIFYIAFIFSNYYTGICYFFESSYNWFIIIIKLLWIIKKYNAYIYHAYFFCKIFTFTFFSYLSFVEGLCFELCFGLAAFGLALGLAAFGLFFPNFWPGEGFF